MKLLAINKKPYLCLFATENIATNKEVLYNYGVKNLLFFGKKGSNVLNPSMEANAEMLELEEDEENKKYLYKF